MKSIFLNKYFVIVLIIIGIKIPLSMIENQIEDRAQQREVAKQAVRNSWTGEQKLLVGVLVIPYEEKRIVRTVSGLENLPAEKIEWIKHQYTLVAEHLNLSATLENQSLMKGIYQVPVYTANVHLISHFNLAPLKKLQQDPQMRFTQQPYVSVGVSDSRGLVGLPQIKLGERIIEVSPASQFANFPAGFHANLAKEFIELNDIEVTVEMKVKGMESLSFIAAAKDSEVSARSDWPHPEFIGAFLPASRDINQQGYAANWQTGLFSTNITSTMQRCDNGDCSSLSDSVFGVRHIQPVDIYLQSLRSVKYGLLIVLVTFCIFVLYEIINVHQKIHPLSYLLTGTALAIFFLLLIALSEHIAFAFAYWIACFACVGLIAIYVASQSGQRRYGLIIMAILSLLYLILFLIIRSEDYALLSGSLLLFFLLAVVMVVTRKIDWYGIGKRKA